MISFVGIVGKILCVFWIIDFLVLSQSFLGISNIELQVFKNIPQSEFSTLHDFYDSTNGPTWEWSGVVNASAWDFTVPYPTANPCADHWTGVVCTCPVKSTTCHVSQLLLPSHALSGRLPKTISNLTQLTTMNLAHNYLGGFIPSTLFKLKNLHTLSLVNNLIFGSIPSNIDMCTSLSSLSLDNNFLSGTIPINLYNTLSLTSVSISFNNFYGTISPLINNLQHLTIFDLNLNSFNGTIPSELFYLPNITDITLSANSFSGHCALFLPPQGPIPKRLLLVEIASNNLKGNFSSPDILFYQAYSLWYVYLSHNQLTGHILPQISNVSNLDILDLSFNDLDGTLPNELSTLIHMNILLLSNNYFTSSIPPQIGNLKQLSVLSLAYNKLTSSLPDSIGALPLLVYLYLQQNLFTGSIPDTIQWYSMVEMDISINSLTGTFPPSFFLACNESLHWIYAHDNAFHGSLLPANSSFALMSMVFFSVAANQFTGNLPVGMFANVSVVGGGRNTTVYEYQYTWKNLLDYIVDDNYFTGTLPPIMQYSESVTSVWISESYIHGPIPPWIFTFSNISQLQLSNNVLSGSIPTRDSIVQTMYQDVNCRLLEIVHLDHNFLTGSLSNAAFQYCKNLVEFELNDNQLSGNFPDWAFNSVNAIQILFLHNNALTGTIPDVIEDHSRELRNIDVSDNQLTGTIPDSIFRIKILKSFAAVSNCMTGSISSGICAARNLTGLALDGLSTARACRQPIFALLSNEKNNFLNSYYLQFHITGGIPSCLFSLPYLSSLHLSGNALTGSLPTDLLISDSLVDVSLSYNRFTGSIPEVIQTHGWQNLDLSYNRLTGELSSDGFEAFQNLSNNFLYLQVNRISGEVPSQLLAFKKISILQGNLFGCSVNRKELPTNDPEYDTYSCGSNVTNTAILVWLGISFIPLTMLFCLYLKRRNAVGDRKEANDETISIHTHNEEEQPEKSSLSSNSIVSLNKEEKDSSISLGNLSYLTNEDPMTEHSKVFVRKSKFVMGEKYLRNIFTDIREWRRVMMSTNDNKIMSIRFGRTNPIYFFSFFVQTIRRIFVFLTALLILAYVPLYAGLSEFCKSYSQEYVWTVSALLLSGLTPGVILTIAFGSFIILAWNLIEYNLLNSFLWWKETRSISENETYNYWKRFGMACLFCVNFVTMVLIDVVYVIVYINGNAVAVFFMQLFIAVFKLFWHQWFLWECIQRIQATYAKEELATNEINERSTEHEGGLTLHEDEESKDEHIQVAEAFPRSMSIQSTTSTLHYHPSTQDIIQFLVILALNNIFIPCLAIMVVDPTCFYNAFVAVTPIEASYSYKTCTKYLTILVKRICIQYTETSQDINYNPPFTYSYQCSSSIIRNYIPVHIISCIITGFIVPLCKVCVIQLHLYASRNHQEHLKAMLARNCGLLLPAAFRDLVPSPPPPQLIDTSNSALYEKHRLIVQINSYLMILLSFGLLFPPLAIIICISIIIVTVFDELMIGKLLYQAKLLGYTWYQAQIEVECDNVANGFHITIWIALMISSLVCSYIVYDTFGDAFGWKIAAGPAIGLAIIPIILFSWEQYKKSKKAMHRTQSTVQREANNVSIEMTDNVLHSSNPINNSK